MDIQSAAELIGNVRIHPTDTDMMTPIINGLSIVAKLELQFRRDERVLRFLTFRLDKYALEYANKRINKAKQEEK